MFDLGLTWSGTLLINIWSLNLRLWKLDFWKIYTFICIKEICEKLHSIVQSGAQFLGKISKYTLDNKYVGSSYVNLSVCSFRM